MVIELYLLGALVSWALMYRFLVWFCKKQFPFIYKYEPEREFRNDAVTTFALSIVWPISIFVLPLYSFFWWVSNGRR